MEPTVKAINNIDLVITFADVKPHILEWMKSQVELNEDWIIVDGVHYPTLTQTVSQMQWVGGTVLPTIYICNTKTYEIRAFAAKAIIPEFFKGNNNEH